MQNLLDFSFEELMTFIESGGKERFRARQIYKWVYEKRVYDFAQMTDLSKKFREEIKEKLYIELPEVVEFRKSKDGTEKYLFDVGDGMTVEAVMIPSDGRKTLCVSSEVGCNMACTFCFTGKQKLKKRLSVGQILGQFLVVDEKQDPSQPISNIVFMGMGEPLDNLEGVFGAVKILIDDRGINLSRKKITISTSGLINEMPRVTESGVRLAVSLNAPNDEIRNKIMPINKKYPLKSLMQACKEHAAAAKDRVTFEYVLLKGVNDRIEHAREVYQWIKDVPCKMNLIPFNEHPDSGFLRPASQVSYSFQKYLLSKGVHTTIRKTMGRDIFAACGQLTSLHEDKPVHQDVETGVLG